MKNTPITVLVATLAQAALYSGVLTAAVVPNPLFTDGVVLQRGQPVPIWGTARNGEKVTVEFGTQKLSTTAANGTWRVDLTPLTAGGPFTLILTGDNTVTVNNVLVGEVWICSGQSNMEFPFASAANAAEESPKADYPKIRMFTVTKKISAHPLTEAEGRWVTCSPQTVKGFSAVGYFFAKDIYQKLGIPVGMIHTSWGGTPAQAWTSIEGFGIAPELKGYADAAKKNLENYPASAEKYSIKPIKVKKLKNNTEDTAGKNNMRAPKARNKEAAKAKQAGQPLPQKTSPSKAAPSAPALPAGSHSMPATLFNGMVNPLIPYAIKGVIWYQGETNRSKPRQYRTLFPALIANWRAKWKQGDFPFLFVQVAPFNEMPPEIREAQLLTLAKSPNTAMAVTTDVGDAGDIHPSRKQPVGQRLALAAHALAYGEKIEYSGPLYQSMKIEGNQVVLSFTHIGTGLVAKAGDLKGFTIAGADGRFVPAKAVINGPQVIVSAERVTNPKAARYGWTNVPDVNLYNKEGIPASPFRTDLN